MLQHTAGNIKVVCRALPEALAGRGRRRGPELCLTRHASATSTLANLSDMSFISRLDVSLRLHRMLRIEAYVMADYGEPGGEFRVEFDVPEGLGDLLGMPLPEGTFRGPMLDFGVNLRVSM